jgi:hypothetical protein
MLFVLWMTALGNPNAINLLFTSLISCWFISSGIKSRRELQDFHRRCRDFLPAPSDAAD